MILLSFPSNFFLFKFSCLRMFSVSNCGLPPVSGLPNQFNIAVPKVWSVEPWQKRGPKIFSGIHKAKTTFLMKCMVILTNAIFWYYIMKCLNHLENLRNLVNQYFPNDQCMTFQNHALVKDPFKLQDKPMDLNENVLKVHWHSFRFHDANNVLETTTHWILCNKAYPWLPSKGH